MSSTNIEAAPSKKRLRREMESDESSNATNNPPQEPDGSQSLLGGSAASKDGSAFHHGGSAAPSRSGNSVTSSPPENGNDVDASANGSIEDEAALNAMTDMDVDVPSRPPLEVEPTIIKPTSTAMKDIIGGRIHWYFWNYCFISY